MNILKYNNKQFLDLKSLWISKKIHQFKKSNYSSKQFNFIHIVLFTKYFTEYIFFIFIIKKKLTVKRSPVLNHRER